MSQNLIQITQTKPFIKKLMQKYLKYSILIILILLVSGLGYIVYKSYNTITPAEYDKELASQRNEIILSIDQMTNEMNSATDDTKLATQINSLEQEINTYSEMINRTEEPTEVAGLKEKNEEFLATSKIILSLAKQFQETFKDDSQIDVYNVITEYNDRIEEINTQNQEIETMVKENQPSFII